MSDRSVPDPRARCAFIASAGSSHALLLALVLLAGSGCDRPGGSTATGATAAAPDKSRALEVRTVYPVRREMIRSVRLPGTVRADFEVTLFSKVTGYVKEIRKDRGDRVSEGEVVALLEIPEMALEIEHARASSEMEDVTFGRLEALRKLEKTAVTDQDFDLARTKRAMAKASLKKLETLLSYTEIRAPFDGYVTSRYVDPGAFVQQAKVISIVSTSKVRILVDVPESEVRFAKVGTECTIAFDALPGRSVRAQISRSAGLLEPPARAMRVEIDLPNQDRSILPGMFARVELGIDRRPNALVLPADAVLFQRDKAFIFALLEGKAVRREIVPGPKSGEWREVDEGLQESDSVILAQGQSLEDGTPVRTAGGNPQ